MEEEGLFRLSGSVREVSELRARIFLDLSNFPEKQLEDADPHALTSLLKQFFRDLPPRLIR